MSTRRVPREPAGAEPSPAPARDPFVRRVATTLAMVAAAAAVLALAVLGVRVLLAAFAGILIAVLLHAFADAVRRRTPLGYRGALALVLVLIAGALGVGGWLLAPHLAGQFEELGETLPEIAAEVEAFLEQYGWGEWLLDRLRADDLPGAVLAGGAGLLSALYEWSTYFIMAVFVGLFAALNPTLYRDGVVHLVPPAQRGRARELLDDIGRTLRWFLIGQGITMAIIGVSTAAVLWAFGVPLAVPLGLVVGLLGFIPYLGPIIGAVPVALVAATQGAAILAYVLLAYTAVQLLEGYLAVPLVQQRTVYLPPAITITFQILMTTVLGLAGLLLATPLAAVGLVLSRYYRRDLLGESNVAPSPAP